MHHLKFGSSSYALLESNSSYLLVRLGDIGIVLVEDFNTCMFFDLSVVKRVCAILRRANDGDSCFLHDSCRQIVAHTAIADLMAKHVHGFWEIVQVDLFATDDTVLSSIKQRKRNTPYELEVAVAVEEEQEQ